MTATVLVIGAADGTPTPHDGEYVISWNPHTEFGVCEITTTRDRDKARKFKDKSEAFGELRTISNKEPRRPTDGRPNRPLCGLHVMLEDL